MKVLIRITRKTEYATTVEMTQADYDRLNEQLESDVRSDNRLAYKELNNLIDTGDWQDDNFDDLDEFSVVKDGE